MASRSGAPAENLESTGFSYPCDIPNADEREPLLPQNTVENIKKLSRLDIVLSGAREVAQRNTGLLLIVAAQAFFSVVDAIVKILQKVDPPVTTMEVRLRSQY